MDYKSLILVVISLLSLLGFAASENRATINRYAYSEPEEYYGSASCGGVLVKEYGDLEYKSFGFVDPNERCVWIIRPPRATGYTVWVHSKGVDSSLIITAIGDDIQHIYPVAQEESIEISNAYTLIITFYTGGRDIITRGFSMSYDYRNSEATNISDRTYARHLTAGFGHLKYYIGQTAVDKPELSIFVISPVRGDNGEFKKTELAVFSDGVGTHPYHIHVYLFNRFGFGDSSNKWEYAGSIYDRLEYQTITNSDAILLVFRSNGVPSSPRNGFYLSSHVSS